MRKSTLAVACGVTVFVGLSVLTRTNSQAGSNSGEASATLAAAPSLPLGNSTSLATQEQVVQSYTKLPLSFEANRGQTDAQAKFISRGNGYTLFLTDNEAVLALRRPRRKSTGNPSQPRDARLPFRPSAVPEIQAPAVMRMKLLGTNPGAKVTGTDELPGKSNYFIGNDPTKWRTNVPNYANVKYEGVYPGIDLVYYGNQRQLEYDFVVSPGADPKAIELAVSGSSDGQSAAWMPLRIDAQGDLVVRSDEGEVRFHKPVVYQPGADGKRVPIRGQYALDHKGGVSFEVARYDRNRPLVIDPVLAYSTYLGGSGNNNTGGGDVGLGIAVDGSGNIYVAGYTRSTDFPTVNPLQGAPGGPPGFNPDWDAFVAKIKADGSALAYSTYLGGGDIDEANGIGVDSAGNAYVAGYTASTNFPISNPLQGASGGGGDAFVAKISGDGSALLYSTYLGGGLYDSAQGIAVDSAGNAYVAGSTTSPDFPIRTAFQSVHGGVVCNDFCLQPPSYTINYDAFVAKIAPDGSSLAYSTFLGGLGDDAASSVAIDSAGNAYLTGTTSSVDFPLNNAAQSTPGGTAPFDDSFVAKFSADGSALLYSTYLGGSGADAAAGIAADGSGDAYVTGYTTSTDFPTKNALQSAINPNDPHKTDAFVSKIDTTQSGSASIVFSTYLGGSGSDVAFGITVDGAGNAYLAGGTTSVDFPTTTNALQPTLGGYENVFVTELSADGSQLIYSSYLGGSGGDSASALAVGSGGFPRGPVIYLTGLTFSANFPTTANAVQPTTNSVENGNAFIAKLTFTPTFHLPVVPLTGLFFLDGSGSVAFTVNSTDGFNQTLTFDVTGQPAGMTVTPQHFALTPPPNGSVSQTIAIAAGPAVPPGTYTLLVTEEGTGSSTQVIVEVAASSGSAAQVIGSLQTAHCISNSTVANILTGELNLAQSLANGQHTQAAIDAYGAMLLEMRALAAVGLITSTCTVGGVSFSPDNVLIGDVRGLMANLKVGSTANPITGFVVNSSGVAVPNATVSLVNSANAGVATATTDITGFYFFATGGALTSGSAYSVKVTGVPKPFHTSSPASQSFTWAGSGFELANFVLN